MNTNQSFIGAYARNRRRSGGLDRTSTANQPIPTPHLAAAQQEPALAADPPADLAELVAIENAVAASETVIDTTVEAVPGNTHGNTTEASQVWVDQATDQFLRIDTPVAPQSTQQLTEQPVEQLVPVATVAEIENTPVETLVSPVAPPTAPAIAPSVDRWADAAWEVDSFDIPQRVAELFFDEAFFRSIAEHMGQSVRSGLRTVLVTSIGTGEGRSTVAIGTAIAAAATGLRVALVDVDLDAPSQSDQLRLETESDWVEAIRQGESLESISIASLEDAVTLIPLSVMDVQSLPVTSMEIDRLMGRLEGCFDLVIYDGPAIDSWATPRIASAVDSSLIVRDTRSTSKPDVALAAEQLRRQGVQGIGIVDNFCG